MEECRALRRRFARPAHNTRSTISLMQQDKTFDRKASCPHGDIFEVVGEVGLEPTKA